MEKNSSLHRRDWDPKPLENLLKDTLGKLSARGFGKVSPWTPRMSPPPPPPIRSSHQFPLRTHILSHTLSLTHFLSLLLFSKVSGYEGLLNFFRALLIILLLSYHQSTRRLWSWSIFISKSTKSLCLTCFDCLAGHCLLLATLLSLTFILALRVSVEIEEICWTAIFGLKRECGYGAVGSAWAVSLGIYKGNVLIICPFRVKEEYVNQLNDERIVHHHYV